MVKVLKLEPLLSQEKEMILEGQELYKERALFPAMAMASVPQSLLGSRMLFALWRRAREETIWRAGGIGIVP